MEQSRQSEELRRQQYNFEVPCEIPNIQLRYEIMQHKEIGQTARFNCKYQADYFPLMRKRVSLNYLNKLQKRQQQVAVSQIEVNDVPKDQIDMQESDYGIFVIAKQNQPKQQGLIVMRDFMTKDALQEEVSFNDTIRPTCVALPKTVQKSKFVFEGSYKDSHMSYQQNLKGSASEGQAKKEEFVWNEEINFLLGTLDGQIYMFDPILRSKHSINRFNYESDKRKQIELVKWIEPPPLAKNPTSFLVVSMGGMISFYHKDNTLATPTTQQEMEKQMIKINSETSISKYSIIQKMRTFVEDYNFDDCYKVKKPSKEGKKEQVQALKQGSMQELGIIKFKENICNKRHLNYVSSYFEHNQMQAPEINPYFNLKFDCRQVNDIITFRPLDHILYLAVACNDGYIKIYNCNDQILVVSIKGVYGQPLCLDVSKDQNLLIAGYEDDTFVIYGARVKFMAVCRGIGHKSFVSQVKFDSFLMEKINRLQKEDYERSPTDMKAVASQMDPHLISGLKDSSSQNDEDTFFSQMSDRAKKVSCSKLDKLRLTYRKTSMNQEQVSYRIVSCGEDGNMCFWRYDRKDNSVFEFPPSTSNQEVTVNPNQILQIKPIFTYSTYSIFLDYQRGMVNGYVQSLNISDEFIFLVHSEGYLTILKGIYKTVALDLEDMDASKEETQIEMKIDTSVKINNNHI